MLVKKKNSIRDYSLQGFPTILIIWVFMSYRFHWPDEEEETVEFERVHLISDFEAVLHVAKGSLGAGILAMPDGFKNAGTVVGLAGTVLIGIVCIHCSYIMVACSQNLCELLNRPYLTYTETCEQVFLHSANKKFSRYTRFVALFVDLFMFITYFGVITIYIILVCASCKSIVESVWDYKLNIRLYMCAFALPFFLVGIISTMKLLVPFTAVANVLLLIGLCVTFYYIFIDHPSFFSHPMAVTFTRYPLFISITLYGLEGIGVLLPIANSMKNPRHFLGCSGVLVIAMTIVLTLFCTLGLFGYVKYGEEAKGSITLNLPKDILAECVKGFVALSVLFSYGLQLTASMEIVWKNIHHRFNPRVAMWRYYQVRAVLILSSVILAIAVPNLSPVIALFGAVGFSMLGLFFPALCETLMYWEKGFGKWRYILWKNIFVAIATVIALVTGSLTSTVQIIKEYS